MVNKTLLTELPIIISFLLVTTITGWDVAQAHAVEDPTSDVQASDGVVSSQPQEDVLDTGENAVGATTQSDNIQEIANEVFNEDAEIMLAIGKAESGLQTDKCHIDENEYSCGWLQINLRAHFDKVPGETYEEKAEYLKDAKHNALVGRFIKATSGKNAWTTYTNGSYLEFMEGSD